MDDSTGWFLISFIRFFKKELLLNGVWFLDFPSLNLVLPSFTWFYLALPSFT